MVVSCVESFFIIVGKGLDGRMEFKCIINCKGWIKLIGYRNINILWMITIVYNKFHLV